MKFRYLCKKCKNCEVKIYERPYKDGVFRFLYCKEGEDVVNLANWYPEDAYTSKTFYAKCSNPKAIGGKQRFHNVFAKDGEIIDHINHNGLDNRLCNLRAVDVRYNAMNRSDTHISSGVYLQEGRWVAKIKYRGKLYHIGSFDTREEAEIAYKSYSNVIRKRCVVWEKS